MTGDLYITASPKNRNQWKLKRTDYPKDQVIFTGTKSECEKYKKTFNQKQNQNADKTMVSIKN